MIEDAEVLCMSYVWVFIFAGGVIYSFFKGICIVRRGINCNAFSSTIYSDVAFLHVSFLANKVIVA